MKKIIIGITILLLFFSLFESTERSEAQIIPTRRWLSLAILNDSLLTNYKLNVGTIDSLLHRLALDDSLSANYGISVGTIVTLMEKLALDDSLFTNYGISVGTIATLLTKASLDDSLSTNYKLIVGTIDSLLHRLALADSLSTNYGIQESGVSWVDSLHVKDDGISENDIHSIPKTRWNAAHTRVAADSSNWNTAYVQSLTELLDIDFGSAGLMKTNGSGIYSILTDGSVDWEAAHDRVSADSTNWTVGYTHSLAASGNPHSVTPTELSLVIGTNVQAYDATLTDIADGTIAENLVNTTNPWADNEVASSTNWNAAHTRVAADSVNWTTGYLGRLQWDGGATNLVAGTGRTSLGLVIGTNVQAYDAADLTAIDAGTWTGAASITTTGTVATGTWASNVTIGATETISMGDPTALTDGQYNGETVEIEAGEALVVYDLCYVKHHATAPEAWKVDATTLATVEAQIVMCLEATLADGTDGTFLVCGYIREDTWAWAAGDIWNSTTAGAISQTAPAVTGEYAKIVGHAWTGDIMRFNPATNYITVP